MPKGPDMKRRRFLEVAGAGAAAVIAGGMVRGRKAFAQGGPRPATLPSADALPPVPAPVPWAAALVGLRVGRWTVVVAPGLVLGGIPVLLQGDAGAPFQVDILRRDEATPGVATAGELALYVANGGDGQRATDEDQGLAAMALASALEHQPGAGATPGLLTLRERLAAHPGGTYRIVV